jgi:hypothetical protein
MNSSFALHNAPRRRETKLAIEWVVLLVDSILSS